MNIHNDDVITDLFIDHGSLLPASDNAQPFEAAVILPAFRTVDIHFISKSNSELLCLQNKVIK